MSGMQMTGMSEGRGRGSAVGRSDANDEAGATKTCPRCGAVLFSDMNRCYGCLYDFPEQASEANPMTLDESWENVDEPWGRPPVVGRRQVLTNAMRHLRNPWVCRMSRRASRRVPRGSLELGFPSPWELNRRLTPWPRPPLLARFRLVPRRQRALPLRCPRPPPLQHFRHPSPLSPRLLRTL